MQAGFQSLGRDWLARTCQGGIVALAPYPYPCFIKRQRPEMPLR